jgi:hypothetical protein
METKSDAVLVVALVMFIYFMWMAMCYSEPVRLAALQLIK